MCLNKIGAPSFPKTSMNLDFLEQGGGSLPGSSQAPTVQVSSFTSIAVSTSDNSEQSHHGRIRRVTFPHVLLVHSHKMSGWGTRWCMRPTRQDYVLSWPAQHNAHCIPWWRLLACSPYLILVPQALGCAYEHEAR